ncbi:MAG: glycerophosphodiester phosphodiesterase [Opitutales bacterium]|nr:glycerophosphodiester phosphodiesterase [Opitutales bacterium]
MSLPEKIVIAHRGASGYLPEHSLVAKAYAHALGTDYVEMDVVLTHDGVPVVLHDLYLDCISNIQQVYPDRCRPDGHYYVIDFNWSELERLTAYDRKSPETGEALFAARYGESTVGADIHSMAEEIELILNLNRSTGRNVGLFVEIKNPLFHTDAGMDIGKIVLETLQRYQITDGAIPCLVFSFESSVLKHMRFDLGCDLTMAQLIGTPGSEEDPVDDFSFYQTDEGLREISTYAQAVSPSLLELVSFSPKGMPIPGHLVEFAHKVHLCVYPYALRRDTLPDQIDERAALTFLFSVLQIDGVITDFPDSAIAFLVDNHLR